MEIILATFSALFSVVNPFGAMPVFLTLTQEDTNEHRNQQALKACLYMVGILAVFFLAGQYVLNFFGIRIHDLRIAGGLMIMRAGFDLLTPGANKKKISPEVVEEGQQKEDISFTPLAMPMLSGPGAIAISIGLFTTSLSYLDMVLILIGIILLAVVSYIILRFSYQLTRYMGKAGLAALSRIMGFIVLSIGVNFIVSALTALFFTER
ncbi:MarC family NAAT transporter [Pontibacter sp. SGAir0037]|uniref:MarC family NAAT transporter n=1 Tax=Pontibacter sp. SGAir0037 TaxID=2571030 RepID=UPI0010CD5388|nr:MarC family NAAT transporter [Pontibacter sp. SGAir0037]QCR21084.1 stress protection protein MarC [Pontibacter sp. SGAir0037]